MMSSILGGVMLAYLLAGLLFLGGGLGTTPRLSSWGRVVLGAGFAAHTVAILGRWLESYTLGIGHAPLSNFYESLVFFSWSLPCLGLLAFRRHLQSYLGAIAAILASLLLAYASLGGVKSQIMPLVPALKSNWLLIHVVTAFLGYAAFALGFGVAILYLKQERRPHPSLPPLTLLDRLIYQATILGFLLLTLGILTGAVWAESAWGRYWSWDPKETWSLITWLIYASLLHARLVKGWQGRRIAWLAIVGFLAVLFTYLGVSFLLTGLHSYLT